MRRVCDGLVAWVAWMLVAGAVDENVAHRVLELTEQNYDQMIKDTPLILVEFYASW